MKPKLEEVMARVVVLAELIPYFPKDATAQRIIAAEIYSFVGTVEQLEWFTETAAQRISKWDGLPYFRALYGTRYTPDDGVAPNVWFPGYTPEECEARSKQIEMEENTRQLESYRRAALEAPAEYHEPLLLPEPLEMAKPIEKTIAAQSEEYLSLKEREEKLARSKGPERGFDERRRLEIELMEELHRFNSRGTNSDSHPKVN